jgi:hypothetical protein
MAEGVLLVQAFEAVDYDLHGVVGIRLMNARPSDARAVARQLGPLRRTLDREPDIVIRFVDDLHLGTPLHYLGAGESAFTRDSFLVLQSKRGVTSHAKIPFEAIGGKCEILCESGVPAVPLLIAIINLTALAKGVVPLHASAFVYRDVGTLVTGWSKGGKTEALLAFMAKGAEYLGDEWIYLAADGGEMYGIPQPIRVWDWHLAQFPEYRLRVGRGNMLRLGAIRAALGIGRRVTEMGGSQATLDRIQTVMKRQTYVDMAPERLFGPCATLKGPLDRVFQIGSSATPEVTAEPIAPAAIAERMVHSVRYEFQTLMSHYLTYKFAFPSSTNERIETLEKDLSVALHRVLAGKPAYTVRHPYPMSIAALFDVMSPLI